MNVKKIRTRRAILRILKEEGGKDSKTLSERLKITPMGIRHHLCVVFAGAAAG